MKTEIIESEIFYSELYEKAKEFSERNPLTNRITELKWDLCEEIKSSIINNINTKEFIDNVCLSYRHDFGLMTESEKENVRSYCKLWLNAFTNNLKTIL